MMLIRNTAMGENTTRSGVSHTDGAPFDGGPSGS